MNPDTPIMMITMQIPVTAETNVEEVLSAIGEKLVEAVEEVKQQQSSTDPEPLSQEEFNAWVVKEAEEPFTDNTHTDLLASLGYAYAG